MRVLLAAGMLLLAGPAAAVTISMTMPSQYTDDTAILSGDLVGYRIQGAGVDCDFTAPAVDLTFDLPTAPGEQVTEVIDVAPAVLCFRASAIAQPIASPRLESDWSNTATRAAPDPNAPVLIVVPDPTATFVTTQSLLYTAEKRRDHMLMVPISEAPIGTVCIGTEAVLSDGVAYYAVPWEAVSWDPDVNVRPEIVYGRCAPAQ